MAPGFLIAQAAGRWGNFFNQEAHGGVIGGLDTAGDVIYSLDQQRAFLTDTLGLPNFITNNMYLYGPNGLNYYHPTFLYESIWNILGFILMLVLRRTKIIKQGELLSVYLVWYSTGRFFIEGMRTDSLYIGNTGLRTAQIISILMILGGITLTVLIRKVFHSKPYHVTLSQYEILNPLEEDMVETLKQLDNKEKTEEYTKKFETLRITIDQQKEPNWNTLEHPTIEEFKDDLSSLKLLLKPTE